MKTPKIIKTVAKQFSKLRRRYGLAEGPHRPITLAEARAELRPLGIVLTKRDGEFRVTRKGVGEIPAYHTDDLADAVATGRKLAEPDADDDIDEAEPDGLLEAE